MIVAEGQRAELLAETLPAGVVVPAGAVAIASPIAERAGQPGELRIVGRHGAPFAHGDVMGRIERERGQVAEGADVPAAEFRSQGVAAILDQPETALAAEFGRAGGVKRDSHGVGDHHAAGFRADGRGDRVERGNVRAQLDVDEDRHGADL